MALRFASLGSGSKGNGTLVESATTCVLIDCGFSVRETERRLLRLGRVPGDLAAILVTHEHGDHIRGAFTLARKYQVPVFLTHGTAMAARQPLLGPTRMIAPLQSFAVGDLDILPVPVPHDAREPVQFVISRGPLKVGVLTDLGSISATVGTHFDGCDGLLLEANHDPEMLARGRYPQVLKQRVGGHWGHLSNGQAASLLSTLERRKIQALVLGHISLQNNSPALVAEAIASHSVGVGHILYACQEMGFPWQVVE
jgi:phosphoribosyl 1,2-cyclic phosphodiesterase